MKYRLCTLDQCRIMVRLASRLVPRSRRQDWQQEWQAELAHAWRQLSEQGLSLFSEKCGSGVLG